VHNIYDALVEIRELGGGSGKAKKGKKKTPIAGAFVCPISSSQLLTLFAVLLNFDHRLIRPCCNGLVVLIYPP
jgi:hypothetical protein